MDSPRTSLPDMLRELDRIRQDLILQAARIDAQIRRVDEILASHPLPEPRPAKEPESSLES